MFRFTGLPASDLHPGAGYSRAGSGWRRMSGQRLLQPLMAGQRSDPFTCRPQVTLHWRIWR